MEMIRGDVVVVGRPHGVVRGKDPLAAEVSPVPAQGLSGRRMRQVRRPS